MMQPMQQAASVNEDFSEFEAELPLTFRLRRSWSEADMMELRKNSEDPCEFGPSPNCADACEPVQDDASTSDGSDDRSLAGFGSESSTLGDWAELSDPALDACGVVSGPPGQWALQWRSAESTPFPRPVDTKPHGQYFNVPPPGNWVSPANAFDRADLVKQDSSFEISQAESPKPTTLLVSNLPRAYNRSMLMELLIAEGLLMDCDLVYLPVEFKVGIGYGYAFVNFVSHQAACAALEVLDGFADSRDVSLIQGELTACWSSKQGLHTHIELYRNSPVMHRSVDDEAKPALLQGGVRLPFPEPTQRIRAPRARRAVLPQEADATQVA